jgi:hypothetical protein
MTSIRAFRHGAALRSALPATWSPTVALVLVVGLIVLLAGPSARRRGDQMTSGTPTLTRVAELSLAFEPNRGQSAADVQFLARAPGYLLQLSAAEVRMIFPSAPAQPVRARSAPAAAVSGPSPAALPRVAEVLTLTWLNSNQRAAAAPEAALPGVVNYLKGRDPTAWHTNIPTYARVRYEAIYPGIDVVYYGNGRQLEYDLVVAPHTDPGRARLALAGAGVSLTNGGDLALALGDGRVVHLRAPVAYQDRDGRHVPVDAAFRLSASETGAEVSFDLAAYDPALPLVIDPLVYSTFLGGGSDDTATAIAVNAAGEAFVTGYTLSADFPATAGAFDTGPNGILDAFVTRMNSAGTALIYSTYLGGSGIDLGNDIAVNALDEAFVIGDTYDSATNFPATAGAFDTSHNGFRDVFVARLNATGTGLIYSTFLGGSSDDFGNGIAVTPAGEAFVTGATFEDLTNFPTTTGAFDPTHNGLVDAFVTRLNALGTGLIGSTFLGGSGTDEAHAIAVNGAGEPIVTGFSSDHVIDFPTTPGAVDTSHNGNDDVFVAKLDSNFGGLNYSSFHGGPGFERGRAVALLGLGDVFVTGEAEAGFPVTPGAFDTTHNGFLDIFVMRTNVIAGGLSYATYLGGGAADTGDAIAVDGTGNAYVGGSTEGGMPTTSGADDTTHNGGYDAYVARLNPTLAALDYATYFGGFANDSLEDLVVEAALVSLVGTTSSQDLPTTPGAFDISPNGGVDAYLARMADFGAFPGPEPPGNLRVVKVDGNRVTFAWESPSGGLVPTGFSIEGGLGPGEIVGLLPLGLVPAVTLTLPTGGPFYIRVRTLTAAGPSMASNEVVVHVNLPLAPSAPTNLLGLVNGSTLDLAWTLTNAGGAPSNAILSVTGALSGSLPLGPTDTFSFAGVPPGTYTFDVRATNASGTSGPSNPVTLTFPGGCSGPPLPVTNFLAYSDGGSVFASWDTAASGPAPTSYAINVAGSFAATASWPRKDLELGVLPPPGIYDLRVAAVNACGTSAYSAFSRITIP